MLPAPMMAIRIVAVPELGDYSLEFSGQKPGLKLRMQAAEWLADRGFGKPLQAVEFIQLEEHPLNDATADELRLMLADLRAQHVRLQANVIDGEARAIE